MYLISNEVLPTLPGPKRHTLNLYEILLNDFTNGLRVLCFGCRLLTYQPKQGEILQFNFDYLYYISYLYFVTFSIYNYLKGKFNSYYTI